MKTSFVFSGIVIISSLMSASHGAIVDLTSTGTSSGVINGALFIRESTHPAGSGVLDPFLRMGRDSNSVTSEVYGLNHDVKEFTFDNLNKGGHPHHHDIKLSDVGITTIGTKSYYHFILDINEPGNRSNPLQDLVELEIWLNDGPLTTLADVGTYAGLAASGASKAWDLDGLPDGDSTVKLDYSFFGGGSGKSDMSALIPVDVLGDLTKGAKDQNIYFYNVFDGVDKGGYQEWATLESTRPNDTPGGKVPDGGATLLTLGISLLGLRSMRRYLSSDV